MAETDEVLFERPLTVGSKRVYVDLRRNAQGVYLKLSEKGPSGKSTVLIPGEGLRMIRDILDEAILSTDGGFGGGAGASRGGGGGGGGHRKKLSTSSSGGNKHVYVSGLAWHTTWKSLKDHMRSAGAVEHCDVMTTTGGRSLGCGVVTFATGEDAQNAIATLNDSLLDGRKIHVREDRDGQDGEVGEEDVQVGNKRRRVHVDGANGAGGGNGVFVSNLSWSTTNEDLERHMSACGTVRRAEVMTNKSGRSMGCGVVEFQTSEAAYAAIQELNQTSLNGREILVREDHTR